MKSMATSLSLMRETKAQRSIGSHVVGRGRENEAGRGKVWRGISWRSCGEEIFGEGKLKAS
jgi:hypothetical protein